MMSKQAREDKERYERQLSHYRALARTNKRELEGKPFLAVQIDFWMESIRFLITELEIWDYLGNHMKYEETIIKVNKSFSAIHRLVMYLDDASSGDDGPEI